MDTAIRVRILDEAAIISHKTNTLWKGMNRTLLLPVIGKIEGQTRLFNLRRATGRGERKL